MGIMMTLVKTGQNVADIFAGLSLFAVTIAERYAAIAAACMSVAAIVVPRLADWAIEAWRKYKAAAREEHARDVAADSQIIEDKTVQIAELKAEIHDLKRKLQEFSCPFADQHGSKCKPGDRPGEWLKQDEKPS